MAEVVETAGVDIANTATANFVAAEATVRFVRIDRGVLVDRSVRGEPDDRGVRGEPVERIRQLSFPEYLLLRVIPQFRVDLGLFPMGESVESTFELRFDSRSRYQCSNPVCDMLVLVTNRLNSRPMPDCQVTELAV